MTAIRHHIPDDVLMGYAAGALPRAFDLVVATHVSLSDEARARLAGFEEVGGAVLSELEACEIGEDSLEKTLAKISGMAPTPRTGPAEGLFPKPLQEAVGGDADTVTWKGIGMGAKQAVICSEDGAVARLLSIPAGQAMPQHGHNGMEMTLVLKGAFRDEDGVFARGDIEVANQDVDHSPVAEPGEDCVCLIATDAKLRFQGVLPRIAQPFLGL